jgi:hypothetical protein
VIAFFLHFALCIADLGHCLSIAWTAGGPRCVEVTERPSCEQVDGPHLIFGTPVCTRHCEAWSDK